MAEMLFLEGAPNFRDFGGYPTQDGGRVKRGTLFRSSSMSRLTDADRNHVIALGIKAVCDLRTEAEVRRHPVAWDELGDANVYYSSKANTKKLLGTLMAMGDVGEARWRQGLGEFYDRLVEIYSEEYTAYFSMLDEGDYPVLVNCSAGKDRTGLACAITLTLLQVPLEHVVQDYMESNRRLKDNPAFLEMLSQHVSEDFKRLPDYAKDVLLGVDADALSAALNNLKKKYGSVEGYAEQKLGLSAERLQKIRDHLVIYENAID